MKKLFSFPCLLALVLLAASLQGCMKDSYIRSYTYTYYKPVYRTTDEVRANIKSNAPQPVERPGKLYIRGQYIFLNDIDKGIHVINNANPDHPQNVAFIDIPGCVDLAVKGNTLYADLYIDMVAIDITNPHQVVLKKVIENVFPARYYEFFQPDSTKVLAKWEKRDTTITEKGDVSNWVRRGEVFLSFAANDGANFSNGGGASATSSPYGAGGSMARFAITNSRLYTVGHQDLDVFDISQPENPVSTSNKYIGTNIETVYPFRNKLFIGSMNGMYIYDISNPDQPSQEGLFTHARTCDPVIADQDHAYVTLRSGTSCQGFTNQLDILNISNLSSPTLIKTYQLSNPHGLSKDGNILFICDGKQGLKVFDASNVNQLQLLQHISNIETFDVIAWNGNALVVAKDGLYQYDYSNPSSLRLRSKISIQ